MASISKRCRHRGSEREACECAWYLRQRLGGRDVWTPAGRTRAEAERMLRRVRATVGETVGEALETWLAARAADPAARHGSIDAYRSRAIHVRATLGAIPVASVRPSHLIAFVDALLAEGYSPSHVRGIYTLLTSVLRHARRRGLIRDLPLPEDGPGIPTARAREHALTLAQVEAVISRMEGRWAQVAELVYLTGMRWGEAVAVAPEDVLGAVLQVRRTANRHGGVNDPKTEAGKRVIPLSPRAQRLLAEMELPVNAQPKSDYPRARVALVAAMGSLHRRGMGWHSLRAAHASLLDVARVAFREQGARMGHGHNFQQTLAYRVSGEGGKANVIDLARRRAAGGPSGGSARAGS